MCLSLVDGSLETIAFVHARVSIDLIVLVSSTWYGATDHTGEIVRSKCPWLIFVPERGQGFAHGLILLK